MTMKQQLQEIFDGNRSLCKEMMYEEYVGWGKSPAKYPEILGDFEVKHVDHYGGEGEGDRYDTTYSFTKNGETLYIKFYGWYASYVGTEYEGFKFVTPREKTIIEYS